MTTTRRSSGDGRLPEPTQPLDADSAVELASAADLQLADPTVLRSVEWFSSWCNKDADVAGVISRRDAVEELLERSLGGEPTARPISKATTFTMSSDEVFLSHLDTLITAGLIALDTPKTGSTQAEKVHFLVDRLLNFGARLR